MIGRKTICRLLCMVLIAMAIFMDAAALNVYSDNDHKRILILNSYHKGLTWTDEETDGIMEALKGFDEDSDISVEYMDWKNHPTEENLTNIYHQLKYKHSEMPHDIVITTDDAALEFAVKYQDDLFAGVPIVFCGVNAEGVQKLGKGRQKVTGVTEIIDPENTMLSAMTLNPDIKQVYVLFDNTESGRSTGAMTIRAIESVAHGIEIRTMNEMGLPEIMDEVSKAPDNSIVLITTYYSDPKGNTVGFEHFTKKVSQSSRVPVYHLYEFGLNNGVIGGSLLSGRLHGQSAGNLAIRILKGEDIEKIPVEDAKASRYIFDYQQLKRFDISVGKLPWNYQVRNKPYSFLEEHQDIVITAAIAFAILIGFIIVLVFYLSKISTMKVELEVSGNKLKQQYQKLMQAQEKLVISESRYALLFEKMLNGFFICEPVLNEHGKYVDLRILSINPGFKTQIGVDADEIVGGVWSEVLGYPNQNLHVYHEILQTGASKHFETYYPNTGIYYLVNAFKVSENQVGVVFDNITVYKQAIKEITMLNEDLEQRVLERTEELQGVVKELEAFTYTVSHDLKSPLRAVDGYSRIILEDYGHKLDSEGNEIICNIRNVCKDMIDMINQLLKYSTTSKAELFKEEFDMEERFKAIFAELKSANPDRKIMLTIETGMPKVFADRIMMSQVIYNVLSNAVKFTKHREVADISVGCTITPDEYVFYVKDNGVGFDMEYSGKLFGLFQRLHACDEFEGSGIGLVTVKKIIQKHGGQVRIEGVSGAGAAVYFTLPFMEQDSLM